MSKHLLSLILVLLTLAVACSDSGDKPTAPTDVTPSVSISDDTVVEGGTALFTVSLNKTTSHRVTFSYATIAGTAAASTDFIFATGSDTNSAGETSATILIITLDDSDLEATETFSVALGSVAGGEVADALATGTINDNESALVSYATDVRPMLQTFCANVACHGGTLAGGDFQMGIGADYATLIDATGDVTALLPGSSNGKVIQPGNSAASTLYLKTTSSPVFGQRMPQNGPPFLTTGQQELIRDWIDQGALDN